MDARLFLDGFFPIVDYGSRQPFYVFMLALFLRLFGTSLVIGRLVPLLSGIGVGFMLFLLGRRLFNPTVGLIAALIYMFLPLTIIWSVIVKTEPLTILLACISVYFVSQAIDGSLRKQAWLILAGIFAATAFYVRQPALYLPLAVVIFLFVIKNATLQETSRRLLFFALGYLAVCAGMASVFLSKMTWQQVFFSQIDPLNLIWNRLAHLFGVIPLQYKVVDTSGFRILDQDMSYTMEAWRQSISFSLFIIVGAVYGIVKQGFTGKALSDDKTRAVTLLFLWAASVLMLYLFQTANRGFYTQYFTEALPPLILIASFSLYKIFHKIKFPVILFVALVFAAYYFLFLLQRVVWWIFPGTAVYLAIAIFLAVLISLYALADHVKIEQVLLSLLFLIVPVPIIFILFRLLKIEVILALVGTLVLLFGLARVLQKFKIRVGSLASSVVILTSVFISALDSGRIISPQYEAVWSQHTLAKVSRTLQQEGEASDEVLSGGTIWTFEAGMVPFLNVSHPTEFFKKKNAEFESEFHEHPPRFIIKDGYTHRKFARYWTFLQEELKTHYEEIESVEGSRYPVRIYKLIENPFFRKTFIAQRVLNSQTDGRINEVTIGL